MSAFTFNEDQNDGVRTQIRVEEILFQGNSDFQKIEVVRTPFGRTLILDNKTQSCEIDERVYHESLVHPAMILHGNPKQVFIGGGGEGATLREVMRFSSVEKCTMVDIDPIAVEECKKHLPQHHGGAFEDPRTNLVIDDAKKQLLAAPDGTYDVIIFDLADPLPDGPCWQLYTDEWYAAVKPKLAPGGVLVTQSGPGGIATMKDVMTPVHKTLEKVFGESETYISYIASFFDLYSFCLCRKDADSPKLASLTSAQVDERLAKIVKDPKENFFYDGITHQTMVNLPIYHRKAIAEETRHISPDAGAFLYHKTN